MHRLTCVCTGAPRRCTCTPGHITQHGAQNGAMPRCCKRRVRLARTRRWRGWTKWAFALATTGAQAARCWKSPGPPALLEAEPALWHCPTCRPRAKHPARGLVLPPPEPVVQAQGTHWNCWNGPTPSWTVQRLLALIRDRECHPAMLNDVAGAAAAAPPGTSCSPGGAIRGKPKIGLCAPAGVDRANAPPAWSGRTPAGRANPAGGACRRCSTSMAPPCTRTVQTRVGNIALAWPSSQALDGYATHIEHAAVRDHQHCLARVLLRNALHGVHHAGVELAGGFATGHAVVGLKAHPALPDLSVIGFSRLAPQPVPQCQSLLARPGVYHGVQRQVGQHACAAGSINLPRAQRVAAHQVLHSNRSASNRCATRACSRPGRRSAAHPPGAESAARGSSRFRRGG